MEGSADLWNYWFFIRKTILFETLKGLKLRPMLRSMLELSWSSSWSRCWSHVGRFLEAKLEPRWLQVGSKTVQDGVQGDAKNSL